MSETYNPLEQMPDEARALVETGPVYNRYLDWMDDNYRSPYLAERAVKDIDITLIHLYLRYRSGDKSYDGEVFEAVAGRLIFASIDKVLGVAHG